VRFVILGVAALVILVELVFALAYVRGAPGSGDEGAPPPRSAPLAELDRAKADLVTLADALRDHAAKNEGRYPETLDLLVVAGGIEAVPTDPKTGAPYVYRAGRGYFSLGLPDPSAYEAGTIRTTPEGFPVIVLIDD